MDLVWIGYGFGMDLVWIWYGSFTSGSVIGLYII